MGLTVVLSGATGQIGGAIAAGLANDRRVSRLVVLARDVQRAERTLAQLPNLSFEAVDLSMPGDVAACAERLVSRLGVVDVLVNNAAVVPTTHTLAPGSGIELQFCVNVLAYFGLANGLLPAMRSGSKVICVASDYAGGLDLDDLQFAHRRYDATAAYKQSKQANRMIVAEAAAVGRGFTENGVALAALHPGVVTSTLLRDLGMASGWDSPAKAAETALFLALDWVPSADSPSGTYWRDKSRVACPWAGTKFAAERARLWRICEDFCPAISRERQGAT
jgi:NAD(P)-dependent dehydrogenase (short-subunit alcohol dehydrogenase family)